MFKKIVLITALFLSVETQTAPSAAKVWVKTKKTVKNIVSFYPKAIASFYLLTGLIELSKSSCVKIVEGKKLQYKHSKLFNLLPQTLLVTLSNPTIAYVREKWITFNLPSNEPKNFDNFLSQTKRFHFGIFKINMKSFTKWILASLALDYLLSKTEQTDNETIIVENNKETNA